MQGVVGSGESGESVVQPQPEPSDGISDGGNESSTGCVVNSGDVVQLQSGLKDGGVDSEKAKTADATPPPPARARRQRAAVRHYTRRKPLKKATENAEKVTAVEDTEKSSAAADDKPASSEEPTKDVESNTENSKVDNTQKPEGEAQKPEGEAQKHEGKTQKPKETVHDPKPSVVESPKKKTTDLVVDSRKSSVSSFVFGAIRKGASQARAYWCCDDSKSNSSPSRSSPVPEPSPVETFDDAPILNEKLEPSPYMASPPVPPTHTRPVLTSSSRDLERLRGASILEEGDEEEEEEEDEEGANN